MLRVELYDGGRFQEFEFSNVVRIDPIDQGGLLDADAEADSKSDYGVTTSLGYSF